MHNKNLSKMLLIYPQAYNKVKYCLEGNSKNSENENWLELRQDLLKRTNLKRNKQSQKTENIHNSLKDNSTQTKMHFNTETFTQTEPEIKIKERPVVGETTYENSENENESKVQNKQNIISSAKTAQKLRKRSANFLDETLKDFLPDKKIKENERKDFKVVEKDGSVYTILYKDVKNADEEEINNMIKKVVISPRATRSSKQSGKNIIKWSRIK